MEPSDITRLGHVAHVSSSVATHQALWTVLHAWRGIPSGSREYDAGADQITGLIDDLLATQLQEGRRDAHELKVLLMAENHRLRATLATGPWQHVDDLAMLVRRLVRALSQAAPEHVLLHQAMDCLQRKGLQSSPLRAVPAGATS